MKINVVLPPPPTIIALATAWGPKFGGINAFNTELLKSLGMLPGRAYRVLCLVQDASEEEVVDAARFQVELIGLQHSVEDCSDRAAQICVDILNTAGLDQTAPVVLLGHDDKTGPLAVKLRPLLLGSKVAVIHHMAHGAYQSFKKGASLPGATKKDLQRQIFAAADLCMAVGPLLESQLKDLLANCINPPPVHMLVPGLDDLGNFGLAIAERAPANFTAFVAGRLSAEDDRIKQGTLALRAFGLAVQTASTDAHVNNALRQSPQLRMRGVRFEEEGVLASLLNESCGREISRDFSDYTDDRTAYYTSLASASVALMPSWHEGFGLTAWEAIACELPVIIGEQSGVFRLLNGACSGAGVASGHSVMVVDVQGNTPDADGEFNHTEKDVASISQHLLNLGQNMASIKEKARQLRDNLLRRDYHWKGCAESLVAILSTAFDIALQIQFKSAPGQTNETVLKIVDSHQNLPDWLQLPAARPWRREIDPPSQLLAARDGIVPFDPVRQASLETIFDWTRSSTLIDIQLITGGGGSGKTRLAFEMARRLQNDAPWQCLWLGNDLPVAWKESWRGVLKSPGNTQLLLVIDYAEARQAVLVTILQLVIEFAPIMGKKVRILMLARSAEWWNSFPTSPECDEHLAAWLTEKCSGARFAMPPWSIDNATRLSSYHTALTAYAEALGVPQGLYSPDLTGDVFAYPLYLHLAALAALDGHRPHSASALLEGQLRHEWRHFHRRHGTALCNYDDWADSMAWLALRQGAQTKKLTAALSALNINALGLVAALKISYPDPNGVAGLQPDLLAECLIAQRLAHWRGQELVNQAFLDEDDTQARDKVLEVLGRLSASRYTSPFDLGALVQWQKVLVSALAQVWFKLETALVDAAHSAEAGLGAILCHAWSEIAHETQVNLAKQLRFPSYSTNLLQLSTKVKRVLVQESRTPSARAGALIDFAVSLTHLRDTHSLIEALLCAREALHLSRELAQSEHTNYLDHLAASLNCLANLLGDGDIASKNEALDCAREAADVSRELAKRGPSYLDALAVSLSNLARLLLARGDSLSREQALAHARESVRIRRTDGKRQSAAYFHKLASSLNNLGIHLSREGDAASAIEAIDCARESVGIYRKLTTTQPAAYLGDLARSLNNLAGRLDWIGNFASKTEALGCAREALGFYRELATSQRTAYLPNLAASLYNLATTLSGRSDVASRMEALVCSRESVGFFRELAMGEPDAYAPDLAMSLNRMAELLLKQGDAASRAEALDCARESANIRRDLVNNQRAAYLPGLAASLHSLTNILSRESEEDSKTEALICARETMDLYTELVTTHSVLYQPNLASSLNNLSIRLTKQSDEASWTEALTCARESVGYYRDLATSQPTAHLHLFAPALHHLSALLLDHRDVATVNEGLHYGCETAGYYRELATSQPETFLPLLAGLLVNLSINLLELGDVTCRPEALACADEAVGYYRDLAKNLPTTYLHTLATSLRNLADHLLHRGGAASTNEGLVCAREAVVIHRDLAKDQLEVYRSHLVESLGYLAYILSSQDNEKSQLEAEICAREAAALCL